MNIDLIEVTLLELSKLLRDYQSCVHNQMEDVNENTHKIMECLYNEYQSYEQHLYALLKEFNTLIAKCQLIKCQEDKLQQLCTQSQLLKENVLKWYNKKKEEPKN